MPDVHANGHLRLAAVASEVPLAEQNAHDDALLEARQSADRHTRKSRMPVSPG